MTIQLLSGLDHQRSTLPEPEQWRSKMFWDRGAGAEAVQWLVENFWDLFFSCEEAALVASSYCIGRSSANVLYTVTLNGRAGCYGTACEGLRTVG